MIFSFASFARQHLIHLFMPLQAVSFDKIQINNDNYQPGSIIDLAWSVFFPVGNATGFMMKIH
ncbi:hypothetical protein T4D_14925 [Trichinella pseudospiralis]|uniref:Uncharacterized protein n=1 Tax=Trichinella pseudospiralis TaxID=6337 RepID=A0A0V1FFE8_TRIPS|nr:hypothetical protein T4D_14925 [Trichinella pseudospiralis]